jgi:hypothetical protein
MNALTYVSSASNSPLSLESNRMIVFVVSQENLSVYGESATIGAITDIEKGNYVYEPDEGEEVAQFQVKTKEFMGFLGTFTVGRTYPTNVVFELSGNRLNLTVFEEPCEGQPSYLKNQSHWIFELTPLKKSTLESMNIGKGEDVVMTELLKVYVDALFPLLSNQDSAMNDSRVNFSDEYVYVLTSKTFTLIRNKLPECMRGVVLGYLGIQLLKQLCAQYDQIYVSKNEEQSKLFISADNNRIAIKFNRKMPPYEKTLSTITEENYMVVDRLMMKSILKRLKLTNDKTNLKVNLDEGVLEVGNKRFFQNVPLNEHGGDLADFQVSVVTDIIEDAIIGDDESYLEELIVLANRQGNAYTITFKDKSNMWLSIFRVLAK